MRGTTSCVRSAGMLLALAFLGFTGGSIRGSNAGTEAASGAVLPPARQVIERYIQAIGGRDQILKKTSYHATGTFAMPAQGLQGSLELFAAKPNKYLLKMNIPGFGAIVQGYNGSVGWSIDPAQGPKLLKGPMFEQIQSEANFYKSLHDPKDYRSMDTVAKAKFEGKLCYELKLVEKDGTEVHEFYDVDSGLMFGNRMSAETSLGKLTITSVLDNYRDFDGVKFPTRITQKMATIEQTLQFKTIRSNQVDGSVFKLPASVRALLPAPKAASSAKGK